MPQNASMPEFTEISYIVDEQDRLLAVSPEWMPFALKNDAAELAPEQVAGRSLWSFIDDESTRELYEAVLAHVRSGPETDLFLRCDAPERRRLIEMIVTRRPDGNVEFRTRLIGSKDRSEQRLLARSTPRTAQHLLLCSWCDRINVDGDEWLEVEEATERLELTDEPELPRLDPVVCPACFAMVTEILAQSNPLESP